jgi:hypothetical protein
MALYLVCSAAWTFRMIGRTFVANCVVYSLEDAETHLNAALDLLDKNPNCATDGQVADFIVSYTLLSNTNLKLRVTIDVADFPSIELSGDGIVPCVLGRLDLPNDRQDVRRKLCH